MYYKLRQFIREDFPTLAKTEVLLWVVTIVLASSVGFVLAVLSFREGIDFGDGSTFYRFAYNLLNGEAIYKDFIHFRTPGSYFLQSLTLQILGSEHSSLRFALLFESQVLYPLVFLSALALIFKFQKPLMGIIIAPLVVMLPAIAQLRTAFAFLAVALYIQALRSKYRKVWLCLAGVFIGVSFTFGQESAAIAALCILLSEIFIHVKSTPAKQLFKRIGFIALGGLVGVLPLLSYVVAFSDFWNFLYYTIYYAFVLQPQGMDTVYPPLNFFTVIFYIPFLVYLLLFYILYSSKKLYWPEVVFFVFVILRSITLLGRSDMSHLLFVLPELIALVVYSLFKFNDGTRFSYHRLKQFLVFGFAFVVLLYLSINNSTLFVIGLVMLVLLAFRLRRPSVAQSNNGHYLVVFFLISACAGAFLYMMYPQYERAYYGMSKRGLTDMRIDGINVDAKTIEQVNKVAEVVNPLKPKVIFSYPIQPFYYRFAPDHATRFMTYEPQTTVREQDETIEDLKRTKPEVVIYDPAQAESMSSSLYKINDYIKKNYQVLAVVDETRLLWIMVPDENLDK